MADLANIEKNRQVIEGSSGTDMIVNDDGSINVTDIISDLALDNKLFITTLEYTITASTESPVLLIKNPSGSGKILKLQKIELANIHTVSSFIRFRLYKAPTITTNGTALTISSTNVGGSGSTVMQAYSAPTISANGTRLATWATPGGVSAVTSVNVRDADIILQANQNLLITGHGDGTNRVAVINILWSEI